MLETSALDRRVLRLVRARPTHAYAIAREMEDVDRATLYRRVQALLRAGLLAARNAEGDGPTRRVLRLTPAGAETLRAELRDAVRLLLEAHGAEQRAGLGVRGGAIPPAPIVFVTGSRISGVELRIVRALARARPRGVHVVVPPGADVPAVAGVALVEAPWTLLPFRDAYARTMFVNELPPERALARATAEWARVLAPRGALHVVAPAPLPHGADPFIDFFARLQSELFPDQASAPPERVTEVLCARFTRVERTREADQNVWTCRGSSTR